MDDAVTTAAWTDEEAEALAIQPANALALAAAAAGGKGFTQENNFLSDHVFTDPQVKIKREKEFNPNCRDSRGYTP